MYIEFFRLNEPPFSLTPDPRFLFMSERHREGLAHLLYGAEQPGGFVQLTGEIGSGKTTLCRQMVRQIPPDTDIALIINPRLTALELLASVCDELRIPYLPETRSIKVLVDAINQRLLENHALHKRTVLIIDEAQNLSSAVLEQVRLLTNLETSQEKLLQIILIGQPELRTLLKRKKLRQLEQRITARYHLDALSKAETEAYIRHRLSVAGRKDLIFTAQAMRKVYRFSGGIPRLVNIICDRALLGAYALGKHKIGASIVRRAYRETQGFSLRWRNRPAWTAGAAVIATLLVMATAAFLLKANFPYFNREAVTAPARLGHKPESLAAVPAKIPMVTFSVKETISRAPEIDGPDSAREPRLAQILGLLRGGDTSSSFTSLFGQWGIKVTVNASDLGCKIAREHGLDCLYLVGNWAKIRRFDLPAILELRLPEGRKKRVALVGLSGDSAKLGIDWQEYQFPLSEIETLWDGSFIVLWKPPFAARRLASGMRGEEVRWVRRTLDTLEGKPADPEMSDLYDEDLHQRIIVFQRDRSLAQDGEIGNETLVRLTLALAGANAPSISHRVSRAGSKEPVVKLQ
jgi:general secretion pathway protein A